MYLGTESINQEYFVVSISEVTTLVWTVTWPFCRPRPRLSCLVSTAHLRPASPLVVKTPKSAQAQWMLSGKLTINNCDGNPKRDVTLKVNSSSCFANIPSRSDCVLRQNFPGTVFVGMTYRVHSRQWPLRAQ